MKDMNVRNFPSPTVVCWLVKIKANNGETLEQVVNHEFQVDNLLKAMGLKWDDFTDQFDRYGARMYKLFLPKGMLSIEPIPNIEIDMSFYFAQALRACS